MPVCFFVNRFAAVHLPAVLYDLWCDKQEYGCGSRQADTRCVFDGEYEIPSGKPGLGKGTLELLPKFSNPDCAGPGCLLNRRIRI